MRDVWRYRHPKFHRAIPSNYRKLHHPCSGWVLAVWMTYTSLRDLNQCIDQFLLHDQDSHKEGGLDLLFLQKDSAGNIVAAEKQHFDVNFKQREYFARGSRPCVATSARNQILLRLRFAFWFATPVPARWAL